MSEEHNPDTCMALQNALSKLRCAGPPECMTDILGMVSEDDKYTFYFLKKYGDVYHQTISSCGVSAPDPNANSLTFFLSKKGWYVMTYQEWRDRARPRAPRYTFDEAFKAFRQGKRIKMDRPGEYWTSISGGLSRAFYLIEVMEYPWLIEDE
jgi:hypothetical protein